MALELTSPVFDDGESIPEEYGYTERNVNPPLTVDGVPQSATTLALIIDDPDAVAPAGKVWDHWVIWNIDPAIGTIPEGWEPDANDATEGQNDYGETGYGGPNPPDRRHTYRFELLALDTELDLPPDSDADTLREAAEGSILETARLTGTYTP